VDVPFSQHTDLRGVNHSNPSRSARTRKSSRMYATAATATTSGSAVASARPAVLCCALPWARPAAGMRA